MTTLFENLAEPLHMEIGLLRSIILSILVLLISSIIRILLQKTLFRKMTQAQARFTVQKIINYVIALITLLIISSFWIADFTQIATFIGLFTAAIAITLKDLFLNMAGWIFIIVKRPFSLGDRIQIGNFSGDVIDIRMFQFSILEIGNWVDADQSTGRIVHIPNGLVFTNAQANYNKGFDYIWNEIKVLVTFESDWELAKSILSNIAKEQGVDTVIDAKKQIAKAAKQYLISYSNLTPIVYTSVKDSGVQLTVRYLCKPRVRRTTENNIWEKILLEFRLQDQIDLAYPTQRFYNEKEEGQS